MAKPAVSPNYQTGRNNMKKTNIVKSLILMAALLPLAAQAAQNTELSSFGKPPKGFKVGYQTEQNGMMMIELVPQKQTVDNWTQMVTLQTMQGANPGIADFRNAVFAGWQNACPKSSTLTVREGEENGYPFALWQLICESNPQTGKPEYTWMKAVQGENAFYVKQYAFRYAPNKAEVGNAMGHLRDLAVCDNSAKHPCGKSGK